MKSSQGISRRELIAGGVGLAAMSPINAVYASSLKIPSELMLRYDGPAKAWTQALPIGNGRLGAMVFGGVAEEHLSLNEASIWSGGPHDYDNEDALAALPEIRRLIFQGNYKEAHNLTERSFMGKPKGQAAYQTLADLFVTMNHGEQATDYVRELDLDSAITRTSYVVDGVRYTREAFASHPADLIALRITASKRGSLSFSARLKSKQVSNSSAIDSTLRIEGHGGNHDSQAGAVKFVGIAHVTAKGGSLAIEGDQIFVTGADSATILFSAGSNYRSFEDLTGDPEKIALAPLNRAGSFDALRKAHLADHRKLFRRVSINLGTSSDAPTDARIRAFRDGKDPGLAALYFQYGRYLMIAGSRPGGYPLTLQGLWNDSVNPPWGSKYTININTEMNYWPAESCALGECHEPLFGLIEDISKTGAKTAKTQYGAKGWVAHHNTDGWRGTAPVDGATWGIWPMGGAWLCTHIWQRYLYNGATEELAKNYPLMKGAATFFLDAMVELPGTPYLVTCPSMSPEHEHHPGSSICAGPTMDTQIIRDLFSHCIDAANELHTDADFVTALEGALARLAPNKVGKAGQLQEWIEDWDMEAVEITHRHVSHLYGLFPSSQISPLTTPELAKAARRTLEIRGDAGTGWSLAWKINFWARLLDGDHSYKLILDALHPAEKGGSGAYPNLFDAHPPFQIDGNFGFTSGVTEMLLQSQNGVLHLLPALPSAWPDGHVMGLRARGGFQVDLTWSAGRLKEAQIKSLWGRTIKVLYAGQEKSYELRPGSSVKLSGEFV